MDCDELRRAVSDLHACALALSMSDPAEHAKCGPMIFDIRARIADLSADVRSLSEAIKSGNCSAARTAFETETEYRKIALAAYAYAACARAVAEDGDTKLSRQR